MNKHITGELYVCQAEKPRDTVRESPSPFFDQGNTTGNRRLIPKGVLNVSPGTLNQFKGSSNKPWPNDVGKRELLRLLPS
jgi:hypothetical protein